MVKPGLGARIKSARERRSLSRKELATLLKITSHAVRYFEEERRRPKWNTLVRMTEILNTSEVYLITGKREIPRASSSDEMDKTYELIRAFVKDKKHLSIMHQQMLRFLGARLRFR